MMDYQEARDIKRRYRMRMSTVKVSIKTLYVEVELECGHVTSFTLTREAYRRGHWRVRRLECERCALQEIAVIDPAAAKKYHMLFVPPEKLTLEQRRLLALREE